jgi:hypothetical protein
MALPGIQQFFLLFFGLEPFSAFSEMDWSKKYLWGFAETPPYFFVRFLEKAVFLGGEKNEIND